MDVIYLIIMILDLIVHICDVALPYLHTKKIDEANKNNEINETDEVNKK